MSANPWRPGARFCCSAEKISFDLDGIFSVDWSPNGKQLAFVGNRGKQSDIFVYDLETKSLSNLTDDIFTDEDPSWSKDGSTIFFSSDRSSFVGKKNIPDGFKMQAYDFSQLDLYSINVSRGEMKRLTYDSESDETSPVASPDGKQLLFISDKISIN